MKFFENKNIWKKIVVILLLVLLFQFGFSTPVQADDEGIGGTLLSPIVSLIVALGDGILNILHRAIMGQTEIGITVNLDTTLWERIIAIVAVIAVGIAIVAALIATGAIAIGGIVAALSAIGTFLTATGLSTVLTVGSVALVASAVLSVGYKTNMFLPLFSLSPEEIFSGDILLFDINFFDPQEEIYIHTEYVFTKTRQTNSGVNYTTETEDGRSINVTGWTLEEIYAELDHSDEEPEEENDSQFGNVNITYTTKEENIKYYYYLRDPSLGDTTDNRVITSAQNSALTLQPLISQWYNAIRNIAIVVSMSVLIYIGIRMLLAVVGSEKAKYRQMLIDWVVGLCLLFFLHYIMSFSVTIVEYFTDIVSTTNEDVLQSDLSSALNSSTETSVDDAYKYNGEFVLMEDDDNGKISAAVEEAGLGDFIQDSYILWPTNMMGALRIKAQVSYGDTSFVGYGICYVVLVLFTVYFTFVYLKRVLYMAFLTMIAPLVALTYPIDKISDGQAQGFNKWLKEYIFNLLIQPLHLLLYTLLVTSAYELASTNVIYAIVAVGFLIPAEELMRSLFGFEKAKTPPSAAGIAAGAAMLNTGFQSILRQRLPGKKGGGKGDGKGSDGSDGGSSPRTGYNSSLEDMANEDTLQPTLAEGEPEADNNNNEEGEPEADNNNNEEGNPLAYMLDSEDENYSYDENYGNQYEYDPAEYDPAEIEAQMRDMYGDDLEEGNNSSSERDSSLTNSSDSSSSTSSTSPGDPPAPPHRDPPSRREIRQRRRARNREQNKEVAKFLLKSAGRNAKDRLKQAGLKAAELGSKAVVGGALGLTAAAVGATIGVATGDPSKVATFAGGAGLAAGGLGASMVNPTGDFSKSATRMALDRIKHGDNYDEYLAEENKKKWMRNTKNWEELEKNFSSEKIREMEENGFIDKCLDNNMTDVKDIIATQQVVDEGYTINEALTAYKNEKDNNFSNLKPKDKKEILYDDEFGYKQQFKEANSALSDNDAHAKAKRLGNATDLFAKKKSKVK